MDAINKTPDVTGLILKWSEGDKHAQEQLYLFSFPHNICYFSVSSSVPVCAELK